MIRTLAAWMILMAVGCSSETALVVEMRSSLAVPGDVDQVRIQAVGSTSGAMLDRTIDLPGAFPHTFVVKPGDDSTEMVTATVTGLSGGVEIASATGSGAFVEGETSRIALTLGTAPPIDGGMPDAGPCMVVDDCNDGVACTVDDCVGARCTNTPDDAMCDPGEICSVGTGCAMDLLCTPATPVATPGGRFTASLGADQQSGSCGGAGGSEAYFELTLAERSDVFITTHHMTVDSVIYVRDGACDGAELGCNDNAEDGTGLVTSLIQQTLDAGTYIVVVDTKVAMSADVVVDLYVSPAATRAAEACGRPARISSTAVMGTSCDFRSDVGGGCPGQGGTAFDGNDVIHYFVVTGGSRMVSFDTCSGCTPLDTALELRRVCSDAEAEMSRVTCAVNTCRSSCSEAGAPSQSRASATLEPGLYYLVLGQNETDCGDFEITTTGL